MSIFRIVKFSVILFCIAATSAFAQQGQKKFINPERLNKPNGFSHVVVAGGTIYVSGQVSVSAKGEPVGKGDLRAQTIQVFENIKTCLTAAGVAFTDVVKVNYYVVNCKPEDVAIVREIRKNYLPVENAPASTLVGVTSLVNPDFLIEIEVIARGR